MTTKQKWRIVDISASEQKSTSVRSKPVIAPLQRSLQNAKIHATAETIEEWFFTPQSDDVSPYDFAITLAETFLEEMSKTDLELAVSPTLFIKKICAATTAYVHYDQMGKQVSAPRTLQKPPRGWTAQTHVIWQDYVQSMYLNHSFFDRLWLKFPSAIWEESYPSIRHYLQGILPYFIRYDETLLVDHELIARNSEGEYVDPADADAEEMDDAWD